MADDYTNKRIWSTFMLISSDQEGERHAAVDALHRLLETPQGVKEFIISLQFPREKKKKEFKPSENEGAAMRWMQGCVELITRVCLLSEREEGFICSLYDQLQAAKIIQPSPRQEKWFRSIYLRIMRKELTI